MFLFYTAFVAVCYLICETSRNKLFVFFICIFFIFVSSWYFGFRDIGYGTDTSSYLDAYNNMSLDSPFRNLNWEVGYVYYMWVVKSLGLSFQWFQFILSFIFLSLVLYFSFVFSKKYWLGFFFVVSSPFFLTLLINIQRQGVAASIVLLAMIYFARGRFVFSVFLGFMSGLFHISAVLFFCIVVGVSIVILKRSYLVLGIFLTLSLVFFFKPEVSVPVVNVFNLGGFEAKVQSRWQDYILSSNRANIGISFFFYFIVLIFFGFYPGFIE